MEIIDYVYREFQNRYRDLDIVRYNRKRTNLILRTCPFCQNPNWNFEIELSEKFVFNCWACNKSGLAQRILYDLFMIDIRPLLIKRGLIKRDQKWLFDFQKIKKSKDFERIEKFFDFFFEIEKRQRIESLVLSSIKDERIKLVFENNRDRIRLFRDFEYKRLKIKNALVILGRLRRGLFVFDLDQERAFKTQMDLFLLNESADEDEIVFVEGFSDFLRHYRRKTCLIISQTNIRKDLLESFFDLESVKSKRRLILSLDKDSEEPFLERLFKIKDVRFRYEIFVLDPNNHSPKDSFFLTTKVFF